LSAADVANALTGQDALTLYGHSHDDRRLYYLLLDANTNPATTWLPEDFSRDNVRVLLRLDPSKVDLSKKGVHRKDKDFAVIWARNYGKGRVLYNGLGHREEVWERPDIQKMWIGMVRWAMGDLPGDATPKPSGPPQ